MTTSLPARKITVAAALSAIAVVLGATQLGFIPVPTPAGHATIMHIPAILGGILEGPVVGVIVGGIFGIYSFLDASIPIFKDPLVAILPRLFIGLFAYYAYVLAKRWGESLAVIVAAIIGTLTNTVLVLGMIVLRGYLDAKTALAIGITHGLPEAVVAVIITLPVVLAWKRIGTGKGGSDL